MSVLSDSGHSMPLFKAVSGSARQLFQLLNCIRFAPKVQVKIDSLGLRFAVEESRVLQGVTFLDKALFTSFQYNPPESEEESREESPAFQISLPALLETLQIFGVAENNRFSKSDDDSYTSNIRPGRPNAFSNQTLGMAGLCRLSYDGVGEPFSIILEESGVVTTCNLVTYEAEAPDEIPFQRDEVEVKIIMQARWLYDAISELSSTNPYRLDLVISPSSPCLSLSGVGALGSASVEFGKKKDLLETFEVERRWAQSYKFDMLKAASDAMRLASKVSIRGDAQGVLNLQFMVEVDGGGVSFVSYTFVPFDEEVDSEDTEGEDGEETFAGEEEEP